MKKSYYVKGNWHLRNVITFWNGIRRIVWFFIASKDKDAYLKSRQLYYVGKTVLKYGEKVPEV